MSLLDDIIKPTKEYISFKDLLIHLSSMNDKSLYEVVFYLFHHDLNQLDFYHIDSNYKITLCNSHEDNFINKFLSAIKDEIGMGDMKDAYMVYVDDSSLKSFSSDTGNQISHIIEKHIDYYFKKSDLLCFEPLQDLFSYDFTNREPILNSNVYINGLISKIDQLYHQLEVKDADMLHILDLSAGSKSQPNNQNINTLQDRVLQQQRKILALEEQIREIDLFFSPDDTSNTLSNLEIQNIKKLAIRQFNKSLAMALTDLDYKNKLRKRDVVNFIMPYMKQLAFALSNEDADKANNLAVTYETIYDTHLPGLNFKQGRQSNDDKNKVNIELLFKKQLPITE